MSTPSKVISNNTKTPPRLPPLGNINELDMEAYAMAIVDMLNRDCGPYVKALRSVGYKPIYRGTQSFVPMNAPVRHDIIRTNRTSRDTCEEMHHAFNDVIERAGLHANRSNSMFVTPVYNQAKDYGTPMVVFPLGEFEFTWFENVKDAWVEFEELCHNINSRRHNPEELDAAEEHMEREIRMRTNPLGSPDLPWSAAINHGGEIMVAASSAYLIDDALWKTVILPALKGKYDAEKCFTNWCNVYGL